MRATVVGAGRIALEHLGALKTLGPLKVFVCDQSAARLGGPGGPPSPPPANDAATCRRSARSSLPSRRLGDR